MTTASSDDTRDRARLMAAVRIVHVRGAASNTLSGHVADSILNAEVVRAFAREPQEAEIHARNVKDYGAKVEQNGIYASLWAHQSGGFLGGTDDDPPPSTKTYPRRPDVVRL